MVYSLIGILEGLGKRPDPGGMCGSELPAAINPGLGIHTSQDQRSEHGNNSYLEDHGT